MVEGLGLDAELSQAVKQVLAGGGQGGTRGMAERGAFS
jgi:hypothetical protein